MLALRPEREGMGEGTGDDEPRSGMQCTPEGQLEPIYLCVPRRGLFFYPVLEELAFQTHNLI